MPPTPRRLGRRAALFAAATALLAAGPVTAAAPAHAAGPKSFWHYVGSFPHFLPCNATGQWLVTIGSARDYRCLDGRDGAQLWALSGPRV
ncbi:hypothetical protein ACGFNU_34570 [Spirillospora sp. NPDC048911]|uniref:hypothetical protein n=1 Tax=Spirillospora sp. NPDC048911 TaxID=3364527 RepID=UPI00371AEB83